MDSIIKSEKFVIHDTELIKQGNNCLESNAISLTNYDHNTVKNLIAEIPELPAKLEQRFEPKRFNSLHQTSMKENMFQQFDQEGSQSQSKQLQDNQYHCNVQDILLPISHSNTQYYIKEQASLPPGVFPSVNKVNVNRSMNAKCKYEYLTLKESLTVERDVSQKENPPDNVACKHPQLNEDLPQNIVNSLVPHNMFHFFMPTTVHQKSKSDKYIDNDIQTYIDKLPPTSEMIQENSFECDREQSFSARNSFVKTFCKEQDTHQKKTNKNSTSICVAKTVLQDDTLTRNTSNDRIVHFPHGIGMDDNVLPPNPTVMYPKKVHEKCWKTWQLSVKCACSERTYVEERKIRQEKIQDFIEVLRRHKYSSQNRLPLNPTNVSLHTEMCKEKNRAKNLKENKSLSTLISQDNTTDVNKLKSTADHLYQESFRRGKGQPNKCSTSKPVSTVPPLKQTASLCHRYETQQQIIAHQKMQLENQKKKIEELTLENINKEAKLSASKTLFEINSHNQLSMRHKKISNDKPQNEFCKEQKFHVPPLPITKPENKSNSKEKWRQIIRERKERLEQERILKKEAELLEQKRQEEEEKQRTMQEMKEKRRQKVEAEKRRQAAKQKLENALHVAREHYNKKLLQKFGITALKKFVSMEKERVLLMKEYHNRRLLVRHFYEWQKYVRNLNEQKTILATSLYNTLLLRKGLKSFFKNVQTQVLNEQVAEDYHNIKLTDVTFHKWQLYAYQKQLERNSLLRQAESLYHRKLVTKMFGAWKTLPGIMKKEREKEKRKEFWRKKVREILPDFCPIMKGAN